MKKSLFAMAAVTAFAGAAQAQSSVTVYGILDVGFIGTSITAPSTTAGKAPNKTNATVLGQSAETTSRLGFKGNEDLGGGTSAFFTAEFQLYPNDGSLSGSTQSGTATSGTAVNPYAANGGLLNRQSFVGLKKNGIGQAAIGTQYTSVFNLASKITTTQMGNVVGSILYASNGNGTTSAGFTNRLANVLSVETATFSGFNANAFLQVAGSTTSEQNTTTRTTATATTATSLGGVTNNQAWGIGANYTWQKLFVGASYQSIRNTTSAWTTTTNNVPAAGSAVGGGSSYNGINDTSNETLVGATYDFGILKAYAGWTGRKVTNAYNTSQYASRNGQEIGVRSFITPTIEAWAVMGNGKNRGYGTSEPSASVNAWQLGSNYLLSKRTNLYAIYGKAQTSSTSASTYYPNGAAASASQYAVGVRHTF